MVALVLIALMQVATAAAPEDAYPSAAAIQVMADYAHCAAQAAPREAAAIVAADRTRPEYDPAIRAFAQAQRGCVPRNGRLRFGALAFAGGMAEALLRPRTVNATALADGAARSNDNSLGMCLARRRPAEVLALLTTTPATAREHAALDTLRPDLPGCIPEGRQLVLNPVSLRALIALAAYRAVS